MQQQNANVIGRCEDDCANGTNKLCSYAAIETVEESELLTASLSRAIVAAKYQRANVVARCQKSIDMQKMSKLEIRNRWDK